MDHWTADRIADQAGRTFIVTGGNGGLGFETARRLWDVSAQLTGVTWDFATQ